jgi:hypothetical protein
MDNNYIPNFNNTTVDNNINNTPNKKNNKLLYIIILLVIIVAGGLVYFFILKKEDSFKSSEKRKEESIAQLKKENISYIDSLPMIEDSHQISMRSKKEILARAIASYAASNVAIDYNWHKLVLEDSREFFGNIVSKFELEDYLTDEEKIVFNGEPTDEVAINTEWTIESSKVLFWMLGFIKDLNYPSEANMVNANELTGIIMNYNNFDDFLNDAVLIDVEKILDYTDLYYRYHWACREKRLNGNALTGELLSDIVYERRRALEWAIDSQEDWYNFDSAT